MSMTKSQVMEKFTSDQIGVNGLLNANQARTFVDEFVREAEILDLVDIQYKDNRAGIFYYIDFANPATVSAAEGVEYTDETGALSHTKAEYTVKKRRTQFNLTWEDIHWTIENGTYKDHVIALWMQRWGVDTEILACLGDEDLYGAPATSWEKLIDINEGWFEQVSAANGATILDAANLTASYPTYAMFATAWNQVPNKYRKFAKQRYRWLGGTRSAEDYRNYLGSRQTDMGDAILNGKGGLTPCGIPFINKNGTDGLAVVPEDQGVGEDESTIILGDPSNFKWIVHREFKLMAEYLRRSDTFEFTGYMYDDFIVTNHASFVKITGVTANPEWDYSE